MSEFDELLREASARESGRGTHGAQNAVVDRRRAPWLLVASVTALLAGVGTLSGVLLVETTPDRIDFEVPEQSGVVETAPRAPSAGIDLGSRSGSSEATVERAWIEETAERTGIPERALEAYALAASRMSIEAPGCGLGWNTLAGIGFVESEHGTMNGSSIGDDGLAQPEIFGIALDGNGTARIPDTDRGRLDGDEVWDRAVGPMQFIPSTWHRWGSDGNGDGVADPHNIDDAAYSAARYLCVDGRDLTDPAQWIEAVASYNDSIEYNNRVADAAGYYARSIV